MICGAVKLKALILKGVARSGMVFLKIPRLDHYPVILDLKSFDIRLNYNLKYLNYPPMSHMSYNVLFVLYDFRFADLFFLFIVLINGFQV